MINLLPKENKIRAKKDFILRLSIVSGVFMTLSILVAIIMLIPITWELYSQNKSASNMLSSSQGYLKMSNIDEATLEAETVNFQIDTFFENEKNITEIGGVIKSIITERPSSVKITAINYKKKLTDNTRNEITIQGQSLNRQDLLGFIEKLKQNPDFFSVASPTSNLLKEFDVNFDITLEI